jgi:hypothetical protein
MQLIVRNLYQSSAKRVDSRLRRRLMTSAELQDEFRPTDSVMEIDSYG